MAKPQAEKRSAGRVKTRDKVNVKVLNGNVSDAQAQLRDISLHGVFLYLHNRVAEGSSLELVMPLPQAILPGHESWIRCKCRVVRVENHASRHGVAATIEDFEPLDTAKLPQA